MTETQQIRDRINAGDNTKRALVAAGPWTTAHQRALSDMVAHGEIAVAPDWSLSLRTRERAVVE